MSRRTYLDVSVQRLLRERIRITSACLPALPLEEADGTNDSGGDTGRSGVPMGMTKVMGPPPLALPLLAWRKTPAQVSAYLSLEHSRTPAHLHRGVSRPTRGCPRLSGSSGRLREALESNALLHGSPHPPPRLVTTSLSLDVMRHIDLSYGSVTWPGNSLSGAERPSMLGSRVPSHTFKTIPAGGS